LPTSASASFQVACGADNECHVTRKPDAIAFLYASDDLEVFAPSAGDEYTDIRKLKVAWQPTGTSALVLVLDELADADHMAEHTVWIASRGPQESAEISWREGYQIASDGRWQRIAPDFMPTGYLYVLVEAVVGEQLQAVSPPIEIASAAEFPLPGSPCHSELGTEGDCHNPRLPQTCADRSCRALCGQDDDCAAGTLCEPPEQGLRLCGF
jgi:hypothetical protein